MLTFLSRYSFVLIIITGFLIRLLLSFLPGFKFDVDVWAAWAIRLNEVGFSNFYSKEVWTNYTPGFLYILYPFGLLKKLFELSSDQFYFALKLPAIASEIILIIFSYKIVDKLSGKKWAMAITAAISLNPALIFNSAIWGQIDGFLTLFLLLSVSFLSQNLAAAAAFFWTVSFLIKPQSIALTPLFAFYLIQQKMKKITPFTLIFILTTFLLSFPFFSNNLMGIINLFLQMVNDYKYTSLFAYNFWGIIGFWINDSQSFFLLTYQQLGFLLLGIYLIYILFLYFKKGISIYTVAALLFLAFFFLPTRVHERYLYPGLIFLLITAGVYKSVPLYLSALILSLLHLLNLYYVYVYYNEIFFNLPKTLYQVTLYKTLENNSQLLSAISFIMFIIISWAVFKLKHVKKS